MIVRGVTSVALRQFKSALVLGGGGARGLAHLGVLTALGEAGIAPDLIVGTSFGAIVGASFALHPEAEALRARFAGLLADEAVLGLERQFGDAQDGQSQGGWQATLAGMVGAARRLLLWNQTIFRRSIVDGVLVDRIIERLVGRAAFSDLAIPFYAVAFDLDGNRDVVIGEGDVGTALRATSAIPGVFAPVEAGPWLLVDGAVFQEIPTLAARQLGADFVLAVDVGSDHDERRPASAAEVWQRVMAIRGQHFRAESRALADVVVRPAVAGIHWSEFSRADECHDAGAAAVRERLGDIRGAMRRARYRTILKRLAPERAAVEVERVEEAAEGRDEG